MDEIKFGDWLEGQLKRVGITQERYKAMKEAVGLPAECNCNKRKQRLNEQEYLNKALNWWRAK